MSVRVPTAVTGAFALLGAWLCAYELNVLIGFASGHGLVFGRTAHLVISFAAAGLCVAGALRRRGADRWAWMTIAAGITAWNVGDTYWTTVLIDKTVIPVPSWADIGYLAFPALVFAAIGVLMRPVVNVTSRLLLADGLAAGLAVGALASAVVIGGVIRGGLGGIGINLFYALSDLVLLGLVIGAIAVRGWQLDRMWTLMGLSIIAFWFADTSYLVTTANDTYRFPGLADIGWSACFLGLAGASWQPVAPIKPAERLGRRATVLPLAFAAVPLGVLAQAGLWDGSHVGVILAIASLGAVGVRMLVTFAAYVSMIDTSQHEALTDPLTGLGNRRALEGHLRAAVARADIGHPQAFVLYDLDGFKHYNDCFGHPAGDALLTLLGRRLSESVGPSARAYRMGGDEFCVLADLEHERTEDICARGAEALAEAGTGFTIGASFGAVELPFDAQDAEQVLRTADQRMYAQKHGGRASAGRQVADVLVTALVERDGELGEHVRDVAILASAVARRLGLDDGQCDLIAHAAVLHDVGKVAIPDAILDKPAPLDESEWAFMRRHTIVGERIIGAAPALRGVAAVVRASHERWDGTGYPDGLAGEEIPLSARIVMVCDAYDAMRTPRPYSPPLPEDQILAELRRSAGTQFDPEIVDAFLAERRELRATVATG